MGEVITSRTSVTGVGVRVGLTLVGAVLMIVAAFLQWARGAAATDLSVRALYNDKLHHSGHFYTNIGLALIVLGLVAILGAAFNTGWLTRLAGALGIIAVALFLIQAYRGGGLPTEPGAWVALAGSILVLVAGFLGAQVSTVDTQDS